MRPQQLALRLPKLGPSEQPIATVCPRQLSSPRGTRLQPPAFRPPPLPPPSQQGAAAYVHSNRALIRMRQPPPAPLSA
eukprot:scaffold19085_cov63-Phaeocystis_antarctica.AAC.3